MSNYELYLSFCPFLDDLEVQQNITTQAPPTSLALEFSTEVRLDNKGTIA